MTKDIEFVFKKMHSMSSIQLPIKSFTLEKEMKMFGPMDVLSMGGKSYRFVIVDDYSRFTWVYFLAHKNEVYIHS